MSKFNNATLKEVIELYIKENTEITFKPAVSSILPTHEFLILMGNYSFAYKTEKERNADLNTIKAMKNPLIKVSDYYMGGNTKPLTEKQIKEYIDTPYICPICHLGVIEKEPLTEPQDGQIGRTVTCKACGEQWDEIFKMTTVLYFPKEEK